MKKFEYKVLTIAVNFAITTSQYVAQAKEIEDQLNELGKEGWELVQKRDAMFFSSGRSSDF